MNELQKIYRYWVSLTLAVIVLATTAVAALIVLRSWETEQEAQTAHEQIIERYLISEYTSIAEEIYIGLDNSEARQRAIGELVGQRADVDLSLIRNDGDGSFNQDVGSESRLPKMIWVSQNGSTDKLSTPLYFGDLYVGNLILDVSWRQGWSLGGLRNLSLTVGGLAVFLGFSWFFAFLMIRRKVFTPLIRRMIELNRFAAMSQTTHMIAHDVRGPFHSLRMLLETIINTTDPASLKPLAEQALPKVIEDVNEVEDMLSDIIAVGKPLDSNLVKLDIEEMVQCIVSRVALSVESGKFLSVKYAFSHNIEIVGDAGKIRRVVSNLIKNAFQAATPKGHIWIKTTDTDIDGQQGIEVCIGNTGKYIEEKDIPHLFAPYFSKGKQDGTGLGLMIAMRFIELHGGKIWCKSSKTSGTEFSFVLPKGRNQLYVEETKVEPQSGTNIVTFSANSLLTVLLVEDNIGYARALSELIHQLADGCSFNDVSILTSSSATEALAICKEQHIDLAIIDNDLGESSPPGTSIIDSLTNDFGIGVVCLHSSGDVEAYAGRSSSLLIPKPMDMEKGLILLNAVRANINARKLNS